jgi:hypothetical protein
MSANAWCSHRGFTSPPRAIPLPNLTRQQVLLPDGSGVLNTCSSAALEELLVHLKRAYWPFPWDTSQDDPEQGGRGSHGGFRWAQRDAVSWGVFVAESSGGSHHQTRAR